MPGGAIPQEQDGMVRISQQELVQEQGGRFSIHHRCAHGEFLAAVQVQGSIEVRTFPTRMQLDDGGSSAPSPHHLQGGLEVQGSFIASQENGPGCALGRVD